MTFAYFIYLLGAVTFCAAGAAAAFFIEDKLEGRR